MEKEAPMRAVMIFVAGLVCGLAVQATLAQTGDSVATTGVVLNHVGLAVPSIPEAAAFYKDKLGFKEAFRNSDAQGNPTAVYLQVSKSTFIELQQANAQRPAGINHFGLESPNIKSTVATFKQRGAMATEPGAPSAFSHAILANVSDLNGLRIELAEMGPESLQRKAMDSWK
jgi:catechol 2,3-dioxygenase-like lactoylglutathione lyase family enzyme